MRCKKNEKVATFWNVSTVSSKTYFSNEWNPSKTTHIKTFPPKLFKSIVQTAVQMIYFIDADAASKKKVFTVET
jgi:hypothetical protein